MGNKWSKPYNCPYFTALKVLPGFSIRREYLNAPQLTLWVEEKVESLGRPQWLEDTGQSTEMRVLREGTSETCRIVSLLSVQLSADQDGMWRTYVRPSEELLERIWGNSSWSSHVARTVPVSTSQTGKTHNLGSIR